jgi:hypothetical protein
MTSNLSYHHIACKLQIAMKTDTESSQSQLQQSPPEAIPVNAIVAPAATAQFVRPGRRCRQWSRFDRWTWTPPQTQIDPDNNEDQDEGDQKRDEEDGKPFTNEEKQQLKQQFCRDFKSPSAAVHETIPVNSSGISPPDPIYFTDRIPRPPSHNLFLSHPVFISTLSFGTHTNTTAVSHISAHSEVR